MSKADIHLHTGGQYEWDNLASIVLAQAWLHLSRADGSPLVYNCAATASRKVVATPMG